MLQNSLKDLPVQKPKISTMSKHWQEIAWRLYHVLSPYFRFLRKFPCTSWAFSALLTRDLTYTDSLPPFLQREASDTKGPASAASEQTLQLLSLPEAKADQNPNRRTYVHILSRSFNPTASRSASVACCDRVFHLVDSCMVRGTVRARTMSRNVFGLVRLACGRPSSSRAHMMFPRVGS